MSLSDPLVHPCAKCKKKGKSLKTCAGCGTVWYCNAACQKAHWSEHKADCKLKKKEKEKKEAARGSSLADMGSILAALMPPPPSPQRYIGVNVWNACCLGHHDELQKMLRQVEVDVNCADPADGITAAYVSAQKGNSQCLLLLAQHGSADLSKAAKDGAAPIHVACQEGMYSCLEILLDNRVDANMRVADDKFGYSPAMICCGNGFVKLLALLIDRGADPSLASKLGTTAAHIACQFGHVKCLQLLKCRGADLSMKDVNGQTPLDWARRFKQPECIDLLIASGATGMNKEDLRPVSEAIKVYLFVLLLHSMFF